MQEQAILDFLTVGMSILSGYLPLIALASLTLLLLCFFLLLGMAADASKRNKKLAGSVLEKGTALSDQLEQFVHQHMQGNKATREVMEKMAANSQHTEKQLHELRQEVGAFARAAAAEGDTAAEREETAQQRQLAEKNSIFLYDRLNKLASDLAAGEDARLRETEGKIAALLEEQAKKLEQMPAQHGMLDELKRQIEGMQGRLERMGNQDAENRLTSLLHEQGSRVTRLQEQLERGGVALSSENLQALRDGIARELGELLLRERALQQEAQKQTTELIGDSINRLVGEVDAKLARVSDKVSERFSENLASTMESFSSLHKQIDALLAARGDEPSGIGGFGADGGVSSLAQLMLGNAGAGGARATLPEMLAAMLPPEAYALSPVINGRTAAAQLMLPGEQGAMVVDDSLSLEGLDQLFAPHTEETLRKEARLLFGRRLRLHIDAVAAHFIAPPQTSSNVLLFVPNEAAFAEIQAHHKDCAAHAASRQVWMVSPTTLTAALNMTRNALKDQQARVQLEQIKKALRQIAVEAQQFEARLGEIGGHVNNAMRSVQRAESEGMKLLGGVRSISASADAQGEDGTPAVTQSAVPPPPA